MPLGEDIRLTGLLSERQHGLVLFVDGGEWTIVTRKNVRHLLDGPVNVVGQRTGFNEIECGAVWRLGTPRPASRTIAWELLFVGSLVSGGYAAMLGWLVANLL